MIVGSDFSPEFFFLINEGDLKISAGIPHSVTVPHFKIFGAQILRKSVWMKSVVVTPPPL